ncbi:MAG: hypothetical protein IIV96_06120, partial [Ruminococcus sp.]|nr:hypothetical protein [Ruminococcus sp.]
MFGKKKTKGEQPITPEELGRLNDKQTQNPTIRKYHVATDSAQIMGLKKRRKILGIILGAVTAVLALGFFAFVCVWTVSRVRSFSAPTYDYGIFSQMFYNMEKTGLP